MQHDPMCSVPVSYLNMLQNQRGGYTVSYRPESEFYQPTAVQTAAEPHPAEKIGTIATLTDKCERLRAERDEALDRIAAFEERAGCALEQIPVEHLNAAQDAYVMQSAVDQLKADNERLSKECNALGSELCDWRGKYKEGQREVARLNGIVGQMQAAPEFLKDAAPYGRKKDGTPKAKPGRKVPRRRKTA